VGPEKSKITVPPRPSDTSSGSNTQSDTSTWTPSGGGGGGSVGEGDGLADDVALAEGEGDVLELAEADGEVLALALADEVALALAEGEELALDVALALPELDADALTVADALDDGELEGEVEGLLDGVLEGEALGEDADVGCHDGFTSSDVLLARPVTDPELAVTILSSNCDVPSVSTVSTIFVPSGDQLGVYTCPPDGSYRTAVLVPSSSLRYSFAASVKADVEPRNANLDPSGDHDGSPINAVGTVPLSVTPVCDEPFAFIV
jgi:hypothetical protein